MTTAAPSSATPKVQATLAQPSVDSIKKADNKSSLCSKISSFASKIFQAISNGYHKTTNWIGKKAIQIKNVGANHKFFSAIAFVFAILAGVGYKLSRN